MSYPAAFYSAGSSAARPVTVTTLGETLVIQFDGSDERVSWSRTELRFEENAVAGGPLRVSSQTSPGLLMISDPELLALFGRRQKSGSTALAQGLAILLAAS